ncbi:MULTISPECIES: hypothetical protein [Streptomyces]|uniref:Ferredoxin n=1 Tax=Streptomyces cavourensis TaxID=67258 RepID=A0ABY5FJ00_9ACTN|nr:hypothetical protein [Streptomyces cavourensis]UTR83686.1 hypothetical protein NLU04_34820 [Streptomyces cavourensis]
MADSPHSLYIAAIRASAEHLRRCSICTRTTICPTGQRLLAAYFERRAAYRAQRGAPAPGEQPYADAVRAYRLHLLTCTACTPAVHCDPGAALHEAMEAHRGR